jgi:hypothetical protein
MAGSTKPEPVRGERGVQYPADNLQSAVSMVGRVRDGIGFSPASRETIAAALGHKVISGTSGRKLAVLAHFGLLERVGGGSYRVSELAKRILIPTSPTERVQAIAEAVRTPALYAALIERYQGHALPTMLANVLTRELGVFETSAEHAAQEFRASVDYAGLLRNGVLLSEPADDQAVRSEPDSVRPVDAERGRAGASSAVVGTALPTILSASTVPGTVQAYTIPLGNTGRVATLQIPVPVTAWDLSKVEAWITYMKTLTQDDEAPDTSSS